MPRRSQPSRMLSRYMALSFAQCVTRSARVPCPRSSASMAIGKSTSLHITCPILTQQFVHSSKLGEENVRIRLARANGVDEKAESTTREPTPDEEEGSIVMEPPRNVSCGACRTRESDVWWKAPKGLPTSVLCDNCGLSWRKYADLNVRPMRDEALSKSKTGDKREGTPLNGPQSKRAKVCLRCALCLTGATLTESADVVITIYTSARRPSITLCRVPTQRPHRQGPPLQAVSVPCARRRVWCEPRPSNRRVLGMRPLPEREDARSLPRQ